MNRHSSHAAPLGFAAAALAVLLLPGPAAAQIEKVHEIKLDNGLTVLLYQRPGDPNVAVEHVGLAGQDAVQGMGTTLRARIRNYGPEDRTVPVELWSGKGGGRKIEERSVRVPAGGRAEVAFKTRFEESGYAPGRVRIRSGGGAWKRMTPFTSLSSCGTGPGCSSSTATPRPPSWEARLST